MGPEAETERSLSGFGIGTNTQSLSAERMNECIYVEGQL